MFLYSPLVPQTNGEKADVYGSRNNNQFAAAVSYMPSSCVA